MKRILIPVGICTVVAGLAAVVGCLTRVCSRNKEN